MSSPENVDPALVSVRRNFSRTCSLLSRYLKENGSFGEIGLRLTGFDPKAAAAGSATMNLLPMIEKSGAADGEETLKSSITGIGTPMTIFYAGQVIVFNDIPAEKANEIMMLADKSCAVPTHYPSANFSPALTDQNPVEKYSTSPQPTIGTYLPIARKNSLARFLGKRKDRIIENAPYQALNKPARAEAWLGLSS